MPFFQKMDVYRIVERRDSGAIFKTKKVAFHWFLVGQCPEPYAAVPPDLVAQNGLPPGDYYYASTLDTVVDSRIPQGGIYK